MCPWVGPHAPSDRRELQGLPSRVEYLSPPGVLLPLAYGRTASPLWLELRGLAAWQATPSWTVYQLACHRLLPWLRVTFPMVPDAAWPGSDHWPWGTAPATGPVGRLGHPSASHAWGVGSFLSLGRPTCACVCGVPGHLAPVRRSARSMCCVACAAPWATWLPFTGVPARCIALCVQCPGPIGSCSPVCPLGALLCSCGVVGHLAPVHRCARVVCCDACAVSWAIWLLFTSAPARCVALLVRCPGPLGCCSPVCPLGVLCCVCRVLRRLAPVHRCARSVCCVVLRVWCPRPPSSCSPVCVLCPLLCLCSVLGHLAPVHRCACSVCCVACALSWATWLLFTGAPFLVRCCACAVSSAPWLLFTGVPARCVVLRVRCPGPLGSCSPVCPLGVLCCVCGVLGHLAPADRCARSTCCVVLHVRCPGPLGSCSPVCVLRPLLCLCGVLGHLAPIHRCACSVCCVACAVSWATWLLFADAPAWCVAVLVRCPRPLGSCSPVCLLGVLCCVCGVLGQLAPVHWCARSVCCVACTVSLAPSLLFTGVPARCVVLRVWCPGPLGSCPPVCLLGVLCRVCSVLYHLAPVHQCVRSVCCVACTVSSAPWLLFTSLPARCVVLRVRCPGPLGSCSLVCPLGVLCCVYGVLGPLAPVHRCARPLCCVACVASWVPGSCSLVCSLDALCCVCGVLGHLAPVHRYAR